MAGDGLRNTTLGSAIVDLVGDVSDLAAKEIQLAKAEFSENVQAKVQASGWPIAGGFFAFMSVAFALEGAVFALVSLGLAVYWAYLVVAGVLAVPAAVGFACGRSAAHQPLTPDRSFKQIGKDIRTAKEAGGDPSEMFDRVKELFDAVARRLSVGLKQGFHRRWTIGGMLGAAPAASIWRRSHSAS